MDFPSPFRNHACGWVCVCVYVGVLEHVFLSPCLSVGLNAVDLCVSQVSVIRIMFGWHQGEPLISHLV